MTVKFRKEPVQRQRWGEKQSLPHTDWGNIFFDLFYVAAAFNLSIIIKKDLNLLGLLYFLGCFGPVINIWVRKSFYDAVFQSPDDIFHVGLEVVQLMFLATAILHIRPVEYMSDGSKHEMFNFCVGCWLSMLYSLSSYLEIRFWGVIGEESAKYSSMTQVLCDLPAFLLISAATIYSGYEFFSGAESSDKNYSNESTQHDRFLAEESGDKNDSNESFQHIPIILMLSSWVMQQFVTYSIRHWRGKGDDFKKYHIPANITFLIHRHGEWTMLMLGESVLSLLTTDAISDENSLFYVTFYCGIASVTLLQYLYFKSQPHDADGHAMRRSRLGANLYLIFVQVYSMALVIVGVSFKLLLMEYKVPKNNPPPSMYGRFLAGVKYPPEERRQRIAYFFCVGLALTFVFLDLMTIAHLGFEGIHAGYLSERGTFGRTVGILFFMLRVGITLFILTTCFHTTDPEYVALYGLISVILQVIVRLGGYVFYPPKESLHDHNQLSNHEEDLPDLIHWPKRELSFRLSIDNGDHRLNGKSSFGDMQPIDEEETEEMQSPNGKTEPKLVNLHNGEVTRYEEYSDNLYDLQEQTKNDDQDIIANSKSQL